MADRVVFVSTEDVWTTWESVFIAARQKVRDACGLLTMPEHMEGWCFGQPPADEAQRLKEKLLELMREFAGCEVRERTKSWGEPGKPETF